MNHIDRKKIVIGITGGAGSGKSTVSDHIAKKFDATYLHCDEIAKKLMEPGEKNFIALTNEYGDSILSSEGFIDKNLLLKAVNDSSEGFAKLNLLTHPNVTDEIMQAIVNSDRAIIVIEAALLIESGISKICDDVWYIRSTREERINRIRNTRDWTDAKISSILMNQLSDEDFIKYSTFVIENHDGSDEAIKSAEARIYELGGVLT